MSLKNANKWLFKIYVYLDFSLLKLEDKLDAANLQHFLSINSLKRLDLQRNEREKVAPKTEQGEQGAYKAARKLQFSLLEKLARK